MRCIAPVLLVLTALACSSPAPRIIKDRLYQPLAHVVVFWFKKDAPISTAADLKAFYHSRVSTVLGVQSVLAGPAAGTPRDVVDNSYGLLSILVFDDRAAQDAWQGDPVHDELKQRFLPYVERVQVYDALL